MSLALCNFFSNCCPLFLSKCFGYLASQQAYGARTFLLRQLWGVRGFDVLGQDMVDSFQDHPRESPVTTWLRIQIQEGLQEVVADQYAVDLLQRCGVTFPLYIEECHVFPLIDQMTDRLDGTSWIVREAKDCVKMHIYAVLGKNMPQGLVEGIQRIPFIPEIAQAMSDAGLNISYSIDRNTIPRLLREIDDRCDVDDVAARALESAVKPFFDSLLEETILTT